MIPKNATPSALVSRLMPPDANALPSKPVKPLRDSSVLKDLDESLRKLADLRQYGNGTHPTYPNPNAQIPDCCEHIHDDHEPVTDPKRSEPAGDANIAGIKAFADALGARHEEKTARKKLDPRSKPSSFGFLNKTLAQAQAILARDGDANRPIVKHDLNILVSGTIANVLGKVAKHPNGNKALEASQALALLSTHLGPFLKTSDYKDFFFDAKGTALTGDQLQGKMLSYLETIKKNQDKGGTPATAEDAYRAGGVTVMHMNKPSYEATRIVGDRRDHHNHLDPYGWNGKDHRIVDMAWQAEMGRAYGVQHQDDMPIPHQMMAESFGGRKPEDLEDDTRFAYYDDLKARTEFYSHDRSHIEARKKMDKEIRAALVMCHTGVPVDPTRLEEIAKIVDALAKDAVTAQLLAGRTEISIDIGEITGYKPAVPQPMLEKGQTGKDAIQDAFTKGSAAVLSTIFKSAEKAAAEALSTYIDVTKKVAERTAEKVAAAEKTLATVTAKAGEVTSADPADATVAAAMVAAAEDVAKAKATAEAAEKAVEATKSGFRLKTRSVFHADALPTQEATQRDANKKNDQGDLKEATVMKNIADYAMLIDEELTKSKEDVAFPPGVTYEHHLQAAHLMGASVAPNNYLDGDRATELHRAFNRFRDPEAGCKTLRVTTDSSWLTASARAINHGMANFFGQSRDADIREIGTILKTADDLSNNGFMFMHGGERYFETHFLTGKHDDTSVLDMALMRTSQEKAVTTYHAVLGQLHDKLEKNPHLREKLHKYISVGVNEEGLVQPGNYPGLFLKLATSLPAGNLQDATPIVWGTDNLTAGEARSGDLKMLQYISQHSPLEIILHDLANEAKPSKVRSTVEKLKNLRTPQPAVEARSTYADSLKTFMGGTAKDREFLGSDAELTGEGLSDGRHPANADNPEWKPSPEDRLRNVRAPQDAGFPWLSEKSKTIDVNASPEQKRSTAARLMDRLNARRTEATTSE